jgi:hypothetical protein
MRRIVVIVLVTFGLTGCVPQRMNDGMQSLVGQNIQAAVAKLGYPDTQRTMLGDTIYIWSTSSQGGALAVAMSPTMSAVVPLNFNCTIQIATTSDGTIKQAQWSGNADGCRGYASALAR